MRIFSELFKYYLAYSNQAAIHGISIIVEKSRAWYEGSVNGGLKIIRMFINNLKQMPYLEAWDIQDYKYPNCLVLRHDGLRYQLKLSTRVYLQLDVHQEKYMSYEQIPYIQMGICRVNQGQHQP